LTYNGTVIDVDVHHTWKSSAELLEYLPARWRGMLALPGGGIMPLIPAALNYSFPGGSNKLLTSSGPDGSPPGSHYETMRDQLLDPLNIERAILCFDIGQEGGHPNPYLSVDLCHAVNDWSIDRWLTDKDQRLFGAILVPTEWPEEAAKEIRRLAGNPRIVEVLLVVNRLGKPFGHPIYSPIHEAAAEASLPIAIHLSGGVIPGLSAGGGNPQSRLEQFVTFYQPGTHHLSSLFTHGVFAKYPNLHVCMKEHGFTWMPSLLWKLDGEYKLLRQESPWVSELPSETFRRHVTVSTQPFDHTPDPKQLVELLESFGGLEDVLCFATDYPHWDADDPKYIAARLPKSWHQKLFHDNAARFYGWKVSSAVS
jgi:predicted TIM-barrel fold metal-dependent hydrolase